MPLHFASGIAHRESASFSGAAVMGLALLLLACSGDPAPATRPVDQDTGGSETGAAVVQPVLLGELSIADADYVAVGDYEGGSFGINVQPCRWDGQPQGLMISEPYAEFGPIDSLVRGLGHFHSIAGSSTGFIPINAGATSGTGGWKCLPNGILAVSASIDPSKPNIWGLLAPTPGDYPANFSSDVSSQVNFTMGTDKNVGNGRHLGSLGRFSDSSALQIPNAFGTGGSVGSDIRPAFAVFDILPGAFDFDDRVARFVYPEFHILLPPHVPAADYDANGFDDLCAIDITDDDVRIFYGPVAGDYDRTEADAVIRKDPHAELEGFTYCGSIGDIDGDGDDDFAIGASDITANGWTGGERTWWGGIAVFLDPPQGELLASDADLVFRIEEDILTMTHLFHPVGDLNGDGYDDVAYGGWGWNQVFIFYGPIHERGEIDHTHADATITADATFNTITATDFNNDGVSDLVLSNYLYEDRGAVWVFYGGSQPR